MSEMIQISVGHLFAVEIVMYALGFAVCVLALLAYKRFGKKSQRQQ